MCVLKTKKAQSALDPASQAYSSSDVAEIAEVSLRQLQWWDERKVVSPRHEGHKRVYSLEEVVEISVIAELRRKGFSLQKIRRVLKFLQKEMGRRLHDTFETNGTLHLVTDGKSLYLEGDGERVIDILKNATQPMFLVCVSDQLQRIAGPLDRKPVRTEAPAAPARKTRVS